MEVILIIQESVWCCSTNYHLHVGIRVAYPEVVSIPGVIMICAVITVSIQCFVSFPIHCIVFMSVHILSIVISLLHSPAAL